MYPSGVLSFSTQQCIHFSLHRNSMSFLAAAQYTPVFTALSLGGHLGCLISTCDNVVLNLLVFLLEVLSPEK